MNPRRRRGGTGAVVALALLGLTGCHGADPAIEPYGKVFYLDGSGNWGFGTTAVPSGLRRAGYPGDCEVFPWSHTLNPALDQVNVLGAKIAASALADRMVAYHQEYPDKKINLIGLSAGTGVVAWALESLAGRLKVNNVFFLGSSLSSDYDLSEALASIDGHLYVYYSDHDHLLKFVQLSALGTIDRKIGVKAAGQVGFVGEGSRDARVVNIGWDAKWNRLGWKGAHTDYVNRRFIQYEIARKLMEGDAATATRRPRTVARTAGHDR